MIGKKEYQQTRERAVGSYAKASIVLTEKEKQAIEVADFGLGALDKIGLEVLVYVNASRVCAKELVMFPGQTCPEHLYPNRGGMPGRPAHWPLHQDRRVRSRSVPWKTGNQT
jgi:D-lyxose ketol-isomerase